MRYYEIKPTLNKYLATVVVQNRVHRTTVNAETLNQARALLSHWFGAKNITNIKPLASKDLKIPLAPTQVKKSDQVKRATYQLAQQKLAKQDQAEIMKLAQDNLESLQKRIDLEYEKRKKDKLRQQNR